MREREEDKSISRSIIITNFTVRLDSGPDADGEKSNGPICQLQ